MGGLRKLTAIRPRRSKPATARGMGEVAVVVLSLGILAGCSSSWPDAQDQAVAETCSALRHISLNRLEIAATWGQRSADAELAREAAHMQVDLRGAEHDGVAVIIDASQMIIRCRQLGAWPVESIF